MKERLQKIIRDAGLASRREAEEWIVSGRVEVNGQVVDELGAQADLEVDEIVVDGTLVGRKEEKVYFLFNKPTEVVTTLKDPQNRKTIAEFFKKVPERVFPVGRLDYDTEGLLVVTNDGDLMNGMLHPSKEIPKRYEAWVKGQLSEATAMQLRSGIQLSDGKTAPAKCRVLKMEIGRTLVEVTIHEGKNRQVRRMLATAGHPVISLSRTGFSFFELGHLKLGEYRPLTSQELVQLKKLF